MRTVGSDWPGGGVVLTCVAGEGGLLQVVQTRKDLEEDRRRRDRVQDLDGGESEAEDEVDRTWRGGLWTMAMEERRGEIMRGQKYLLRDGIASFHRVGEPVGDKHPIIPRT